MKDEPDRPKRERRVARRTPRSYAIELLLTVVAIAAIYLFLISGGPSWFGRVFAEFVGAP
jgi:hypothetical protein